MNPGATKNSTFSSNGEMICVMNPMNSSELVTSDS